MPRLGAFVPSNYFAFIYVPCIEKPDHNLALSFTPNARAAVGHQGLSAQTPDGRLLV